MDTQLDASWLKEYSLKRFELSLLKLQQAPHMREFHILVLVKHGKVDFIYDQSRRTLNAKEAILLKAGERLSLSPRDPDEAANICFHLIDPIDIIEASDGLLLPATKDIIAFKDILKEHANSLFSHLTQPLSRSRYLLWLKGLVTEVNREIQIQHFISTTHVHTIALVRNKVLSNLNEPYNLAQIAKEFNFDKWNLSKSFRPIFGLSIQQQMHAAKIAQARYELAQHVSVPDLAYRLGYSDQSHFIRFFKGYTGTTPKKWAAYASNRQKLTFC